MRAAARRLPSILRKVLLLGFQALFLQGKVSGFPFE
jgi:hypothetical protein